MTKAWSCFKDCQEMKTSVDTIEVYPHMDITKWRNVGVIGATSHRYGGTGHSPSVQI